MAEPTAPEQKLPKNPGLFPWWLLLLWGILTVIVGIMFFATPVMTTVLFIIFLGAYWLVGGLFTLGSLVVDRTNIGWKIFLAAIHIIAGILILIYPLFSTLILLSFFIIFLGAWACFMGCVHLYHAYRDAGMAVLGVLSLIFGILLLAFPLVSVALLPFIAGAFMVVLGISAAALSIRVKTIEAAFAP